MDGYSFANSMLRNGSCDWVKTFHYCVQEWSTLVWDTNPFYKDMNKLANGTIENLEFENCSEKDFEFIKDFKNLKKLSLINSKVVDISALKPKYDQSGNCISGFPELEELTIQNSVIDITSVGTLTKLKRLDVSGNKINNGIDALSSLTNLEYINLTNCSALSQNRKICKFS